MENPLLQDWEKPEEAISMQHQVQLILTGTLLAIKYSVIQASSNEDSNKIFQIIVRKTPIKTR